MTAKKKVTKKKVAKKRKPAVKYPVIEEAPRTLVRLSSTQAFVIEKCGDNVEVTAPCGGDVTLSKAEYVGLRTALNEILGVA